MPCLLRFFSHVFLSICIFPALGLSQGDPQFNGKWTLNPEKSSEIGLYRTLSLEILQKGATVILTQKW